MAKLNLHALYSCTLQQWKVLSRSSVWTLGIFSLTLSLLTWRIWWAASNTYIGRLHTSHNWHWSGCNPTKRRCRVCLTRGVTRTVMSKCVKCDVAICVDRNGFADYQLVRHFSYVFHTSSWSFDHTVSKRTCYIYKFFFFRIVSSPLCNKDITIFLWHSEQCLFPSPQNAFYFTNLSCWVLEIFRVFQYHAQNFNAPQKNSASWDLQLGFNTAFKGLIIWRP